MSEEETQNKVFTQPETPDNPDTDTFSEKTRITSSVLSVEILGFGEPIEGKVDTGAAQSSMHATEIEIEGSQVSFVVGESRFKTAIHQTQDVSSADGGTKSRPVVLLNITINGKTLPSVPVNLNDRENMPQKFLIGQDIIKAADFIIDLSDEPTNDAPMETKPEQEEIRGSSIAQLGDNPLAGATFDSTDDEVASLDSIRQKLSDLLHAVDALIKKNT